MAMESRPICLSRARRRRPNSSRPMGGLRAAVAMERLRRVLMNGRGARRRLLSSRGGEFDEQQLYADAHELHDLGERDFIFFVLLVGLDADMRDLGEITNDFSSLVRHLGGIGGRS